MRIIMSGGMTAWLASMFATTTLAIPRKAGLGLTRKLVPRLLDFGETSCDETARVVEFASPEEIVAAFEAGGVSMALSAGEPAHSEEQLVAACEIPLKYAVKTRHPLFLNQLYGGVDDAALAGEWLVSMCNTNAHTYEVAPVFTLVERAVVKRLGELNGWSGADGLSTPGGSASNLYGMHMAAHAADPDRRTRGARGGPELCAFVSADAHYSYLKASRIMGLGDDNLISVPVDADGRVRGDALKQAMDAARGKGKVPFFVGSTAGTTVRGAFDAIDECQDVADAAPEKIWHNVDGSWGGAAIFSPKYKERWLNGLDRVDSFVFNPHKLMNVALSCSFFLTNPKNDGALAATNGAKANYLFQPDKKYVEMDTGDKTIQCGRRPDAFKFWLMWKRLGDEGLRIRMDECVRLAEHVTARVARSMAEDGALELVCAPHSFTNVLFRVVPPSLRVPRAAGEPANRAPDAEAALGKAAPYIKGAMQRDGQALVGFQEYGDAKYGNEEINFFRLVIAQGDRLTTDLLDKVLDDMLAHAAAL